MRSADQEDDDRSLERIDSEHQDQESEPATYDIVTYPADYTLEGLVAKYRNGSILVPGFQRKFVWTIKQASRLIESFLLGLPVPAIFLYAEPDTNKLLVVDGQQRLLSIFYFFEGYFGSETKGRRIVFNLNGLGEKSAYRGKSYSEFQASDEAALNKLNDAVLRAFVIKQLNPKDNTSIYHVFERLNTGGTQLVGQEIRNCVYHGSLNNLLMDLNKSPEWRDIYGKLSEDKRQRDIELILRFLSLYYDSSKYKKPMKDFLSDFMRRHQYANEDRLSEYEMLFKSTTASLVRCLGKRPFHIRTGLNAAVFDSVQTVFAKNLDNIPSNIKERYDALIVDDTFLRLVSSATTDDEVVRDRLELVEQRLFR